MTREHLLNSLRALGIEPRLLGSSIVGEIGKSGPTVLLRADTDALPMKEESGEEFASLTASAHTCGHDLHAAMLLTAAQLLKEQENQLPGRVRLLFQPGEETLSGAMDAIEHGALEPAPIAALALHVTAGPVGPGEGYYNATRPLMRSADRFRIDFTGKGGHCGDPQKGF
jgi:amidohydrolase